MTPVPDYIAGARALLAASSDCTINGEPAVVVRVAELNDLVARVHRAEAAARVTPDNPPTSGDTADNPALHRVCTACPGCDHTLLPDGTCEWCGPPAVAAPATADDGLRERVAAAIRDAACNGDCGASEEQCVRQRIQPVVWHFGILAEVSGSPEMLADAVLAVRDRRLLELAAEADADSKQLAEVDERCDRYAAAIARVRAVQPYTARTHGDRSQGYLLGWNAARDAAHAALEAQEADRA